MPYDGITIRFKDKDNAKVHSNFTVNETALLAEMMPIKGKLKKVTANWVIINAESTAPFKDWDRIVLPNWRKLARSARAVGLTGVYLDTEDYGAEGGGRCVWWSNKVAGGHMCPDSNPATWGCSHPPYPGAPACPAMRQCRAEAVAAGKALMAAVVEEWPTARIMTTFGPWLSSNRTAPALNPPTYTFNYKLHPIVGSFGVGLLAGTIGTQALYVDGAEMYTQNTPTDVSRMRSWLKDGMAHEPNVIAANITSSVYSQYLTFGPGVYDFPGKFQGKGPGSAAQWQNDLTISLNGTDRGGVTWAYSERFDWFGRGDWKPNVPADYVAATVAARKAVETQSPVKEV